MAHLINASPCPIDLSSLLSKVVKITETDASAL
jgi:hypothetical protein